MKIYVRSQLPYIEKGGILDDCGPSSLAAAASWAHKYDKDFTAGEGIEAANETGRVDKDGVSDGGTNLSQLAKAAKKLDCDARYPSDWVDVINSAKKGHAIIVNVEAPKGYPETALAINAFAKKLKGKKMTWGHMICVVFHEAVGWQMADPTQTGKGKEKFGAIISEADFKAIASSKGDAPYKRCLIVRKA